MSRAQALLRETQACSSNAEMLFEFHASDPLSKEMVAGSSVTKEDLIKMMYRRYHRQSFATNDMVQSWIDGAKDSRSGPGSKKSLAKTLRNETPALHLACLDHFRQRIEKEKSAYLAIPTVVFKSLKGERLSTALVTSAVNSSLPPARDRGTMALSDNAPAMALEDDAMAEFHDEVIGVLDVADNQTPVAEPPEAEADAGSAMTVFRVVHSQPNRLKRHMFGIQHLKVQGFVELFPRFRGRDLSSVSETIPVLQAIARHGFRAAERRRFVSISYTGKPRRPLGP